MSSKARHFDYSPDEYITGVAGRLRADEQGVYWMICSLIMSEGGPVDYDERRFATLCLVRPADIRRIVDHLVDLNKLIRSDGKLGQKRAQSEVERAANRIRTASENGAKGGRPPKIAEQNQQNEKPEGSADKKLTSNEQRATSNPSSLRSDVERALDPILDREHVAALIDHRKRKKAALTGSSAAKLAARLAEYHDPNAAVDEMQIRGWTGFKPEWMRDNNATGPPATRSQNGFAAYTRKLHEEIHGQPDGSQHEEPAAPATADAGSAPDAGLAAERGGLRPRGFGTGASPRQGDQPGRTPRHGGPVIDLEAVPRPARPEGH